MDNQNQFIRKYDNLFWGKNQNESGYLGNRDSASRAAVHMGWHSINCALTATKETFTGQWDYKGTRYEAGRVAGHSHNLMRGPSPFR